MGNAKGRLRRSVTSASEDAAAAAAAAAPVATGKLQLKAYIKLLSVQCYA